MIKIDYIITNGSIDNETIRSIEDKGSKYILSLPAIALHPYALPNDMISLFSKYENSEITNDNKKLESNKITFKAWELVTGKTYKSNGLFFCVDEFKNLFMKNLGNVDMRIYTNLPYNEIKDMVFEEVI